MKKSLLFTLFLTLMVGTPALSAGSKKNPKTKKDSRWQVLQNKKCGFGIRFPKGSPFEITKDCVLKITLPPSKGQEWIQQATLSLEVTAGEKGAANENPSDSGSPAGFLTAGGLNFSKTSEEDAAAGHRYVTVSYNATGKKHQYHFVGVMSATNPEMLGTPVPHWNARKSAEKIFDGIVLNFKPLE